MSRNIFFDLDGTLVDVSKRDHAIFRDTLAASYYEHLPYDLYWSLRRAVKPIHDILDMCGVPASFVPEFIETRTTYEEHPHFLAYDTLLPNVTDVLKELRLRGHKLYIVTRRRDAIATMAQCKLMGLTDLVDNIYVTEGADKAEILKREMESINDIMVGDCEADIKSAQEAHIISVGVLTGIRGKKQLVAADPDFLVQDIKELLQLIA